MKRHASLLGIFLIMFVAPLFFTTLLRDIFVVSKALPLSIGAALLLASTIRSGSFAISRRMLTPAIMTLLGAAIISTLFSVDTPLSLLGPHQGQFHALLPLALYATVFYAAANTSVPSGTFVLLALLSGAAVAFLAAFPAACRLVLGEAYALSTQGGRAGATFGSPIFLGSYLALLLPLAWDKFANHDDAVDRKFPTRAMLGYFAIFVLLIAGLVASKSRGSLVAGAAGVVLVDLLRGKYRRAGLLVLLGATAGTALFLARAGHRSDLGRFEVWRAALLAFKQHPVFGWGPDTFGLAFRQFMSAKFVAAEGNDISIQLSAHSDLLQALVTMGVVGLLAYLYFLVNVTGFLFTKWLEDEPEVIGIAGATLALFINAKFNPIPLAVIAALAALLGALDSHELWGEVEPPSRFKALGATGFACALVLIYGLAARAEWHQRKGENLWQMGYAVQSAEQFNVAAQVNPFDLWYTQRQLDYFWKVIGNMPDTNKELLAMHSHNISENIARLHPADPTAHELRSLSYEFEGDMIGRDRLWESFNEINVASRLAPNFSAYTKRRDCIMARVRKKRSRSCHFLGAEPVAVK